MVYFKVINYKLILILIVFLSCNDDKLEKTYISKETLYREMANSEKQYCFKDIKDSLAKLKMFDFSDSSIHYYKTDREKIFNNYNIKNRSYLKKIKEFYDYSISVSSYVMECRGEEFLLIIGTPAGATGIGSDYWNYQCYSLSSKNEIIEFSSLSNTPISVYLNNKNELCYIEIIDNYPRPAEGIEIELEYYPVIASVYNKKKELKRIDFHCYRFNKIKM